MGKEYQSPVEYGVIGNLTQDRIIRGSEVLDRLGGSAYFITNTLLDLGNSVRLHTNADNVPQSLGVVRSGLDSSAVTVVIDEEEGAASVDYPGERIVFSQVPKACFTVDCTVLSTTFGEIVSDDVRKIRKIQENIVAADIQGFMRLIDTQTGGAMKRPADIEAFCEFDIMKMNAEEVSIQFPGLSLDQAAEELQRLGIKVCLFTLGDKGALVYGEQKYEIPSYPVLATHTVGAGDTFFASFLNSYLKGKDVAAAAVDASRYTASYLQDTCI